MIDKVIKKEKKVIDKAMDVVSKADKKRDSKCEKAEHMAKKKK